MNRHASTVLAGLFALAVTACGSDSPTDPIDENDVTTPVVQSVSPDIGTVGTEVRIEGSGFTSTDTRVFFGNLEAMSVELDGGSLFAFAPEGLVQDQSYDIRVVNAGVAADTLAGAFQAVAPRALRVNGVTKPSGLKGMTVIVDGDAFSDLTDFGTIFFEAEDGTPIEGVISEPQDDWANTFVVTTVPQEIGDTTRIWVETPTGESESIEFLLVGTAAFSPSVIDWTETTPLPQGLQGLGAAFVPLESAADPGNWVYVVGGADGDDAAVPSVIRARIEGSGELGAWDEGLTDLPEGRAYHGFVAATAFTAALDTLTTSAYLYALGGVDEAGEVVSSVEYAHVDLDGAVGSWQSTEPLPEPLHSPGAALFRGFIYVAGGADADHQATDAVYRARVNEDGTLGSWESLDALPEARSYFSLVSFGPFLYAVSGESEVSEPTEGRTASETNLVRVARIDLRTGGIRDTWASAGDGGEAPKGRSKHSTMFAGGFLFTTSGHYAGLPGSSENEFAAVREDGTIESWGGATGANTILARLGYSLFNQAAISFVDDEGEGHVLVLGGAQVENPGEVSDAVVVF